MAEQIAGYIEKEREKGFDDNKIKQALLKIGYSEEDIDKAFKTLGSGAEHKTVPEKRAETKETPQQEVMGIPSEKPAWVSKKTIIIIISIIAAIAVVVLGLLYMDSIGIFSISNDIKETDTPIQTDDDVQYILDEHHNKIPVKGAGCEYTTRIKSRLCRAVFNDDETECNGIEKEEDMLDCMDTARFIHAILNNEKSSCEGMNSFPESLCVATLAGYNSVCDSVDDADAASLCRESIIFAAGIKVGDKNVCSGPIITKSDENIYKDICLDVIDNKDKIGISADVCEKYYDMRCP